MKAFMQRMLDILKKIKWKHYIAYLILGVVTLYLAIAGGSMKTSSLILFGQIAISIVLAVSLSFVVGFLGELSLGHAGFMCVGAYIGGKTAALLEASLGNNVFTFLIALLVGGTVAAAVGALIGLPALRLKGDYLAIVTLAFCEIVRILFLNSSAKSFGGAFGLSTPRYTRTGFTLSLFIVLSFVIVILTVAVFQNIIRSKHGRAITAIRDSEIAARATGVNVTKYKLLAFMVSAFFAGIAGVLYSYMQTKIQSSTFNYNYSIEILVMVVLGGMGSLNGSIVSAALITFLNTKLSTTLTGNLAVLKNLIYALVLMLIVIYSNAPALRGIRERYNLKALIRRVTLKRDPSVVSNDDGSWDRIPTKIAMDEILSVDMTPSDSMDKPDKGGRA